jgi:hypothetical protein
MQEKLPGKEKKLITELGATSVDRVLAVRLRWDTSHVVGRETRKFHFEVRLVCGFWKCTNIYSTRVKMDVILILQEWKRHFFC